MRVLVTGAAGYIGSHVVLALEEAGHETVLLDDLSTGHERNLRGQDFHRASVLDASALQKALEGVTGVAHLAGAALVPESIVKPLHYWRLNLGGGLTLLEEMARAGVRDLVFSSTCAVYGVPEEVPIVEDNPHRPVTPYGSSKAAYERLLLDAAATTELRPMIFRYFNAAGAHESGSVGELHDPETHLIPIVLDVLRGAREKVVIYGRDYDTPDGTCIRDYIDVRDIARAHVLALEGLHADELTPTALNLGQGIGHSVLEVIEACERVSGLTVTREDGARRDGDPPRLLARPERAKRELGWEAEHDLDAMVQGAWNFASSLGPAG